MTLTLLLPLNPLHTYLCPKSLQLAPHYLSMPAHGCSRQEPIPACTALASGYTYRLSLTIIPLLMYYIGCEPCTVLLMTPIGTVIVHHQVQQMQPLASVYYMSILHLSLSSPEKGPYRSSVRVGYYDSYLCLSLGCDPYWPE